LDTTLWHRRFGHLNIADVKQLLSKDLVSGMDVNVQNTFDPICVLKIRTHKGTQCTGMCDQSTDNILSVYLQIY
jgi:hypothetical protein